MYCTVFMHTLDWYAVRCEHSTSRQLHVHEHTEVVGWSERSHVDGRLVGRRLLRDLRLALSSRKSTRKAHTLSTEQSDGLSSIYFYQVCRKAGR